MRSPSRSDSARHSAAALTASALAIAIVLATGWATAVAAGETIVTGEATVTVAATTAAALTPPMVTFDVRDGAGRSRASHEDSDDLAALPALAVLDTGASTHLLSHDTALRFGVRSDGGARWVETGLAGEHTLAVSLPYTLAVGAEPSLLLPAQRLLLNDVPATAEAMLTSPGAIVDVIGMPALEHATFELGGGELGLPSASILAAGATVHAQRWIPLALVDFNHRSHPGNRGTPPTTTANPVLRGVHVTHGARAVRGDWLLDTGSAVSVLSTAGARALGLSAPAPLSAPVGGMSGAEQALSGWRVDRIELTTAGDGVLALTGAAVFVHDVTTTADDGTRSTLDGILGANLLAAFPRVVIDVPHARLGVDLPAATAARGR